MIVQKSDGSYKNKRLHSVIVHKCCILNESFLSVTEKFEKTVVSRLKIV